MIRPSRSAACDPAMLKVMHVEAGENFYGGARQVAFLIEGLARRGIDNVVVCPEHSLTARRMGELPVRLRPNPLAADLDLPLIFRLRRMLREKRPVLMHHHSRHRPETHGALAGRLPGVPFNHSPRQKPTQPPPNNPLHTKT